MREYYNSSMKKYYNLSMRKHYNLLIKEYHNLSMRKFFISITIYIILANNILSIEEYHNSSMKKSFISTIIYIILVNNIFVMSNSISKSTITIITRYIHNSLSWYWFNTNSLFIAYISLSFKDRSKSILLSYHWEKFLKDYLDIAFRDIIIDIVIYKAWIEYKKSLLNLFSDNHSFIMKIFNKFS